MKNIKNKLIYASIFALSMYVGLNKQKFGCNKQESGEERIVFQLPYLDGATILLTSYDRATRKRFVFKDKGLDGTLDEVIICNGYSSDCESVEISQYEEKYKETREKIAAKYPW